MGKVFDWDKAAQIIKERKPESADAGLMEDWFWTADCIYENGKPLTEGSSAWLASFWATPVLKINSEIIMCYKTDSEAPEWSACTNWPESALQILMGGE